MNAFINIKIYVCEKAFRFLKSEISTFGNLVAFFVL